MFIKMKTAHDENDIMLNTDHIVLVTYFPESNMSKIDTVIHGQTVWVDDNFMDVLRSATETKEVT